MAESRTERQHQRLCSGATALALLAALAAPALAQNDARIANVAKREQTLRTMRMLMDAMFGSGESVGFIADMGRVPSSLSELAAATGSPAYATSGAGGVGMGYGGPYLSRAAAAGASLLDGWNTPIALVTTSSTVQLQSAGPDRDLSTAEDNVLYPITPRTSHGMIEVNVYNVSSTGTATLATTSDADVTVYFASNGAQSSVLAEEGTGAFQASGIHVGQHYVSASAQDPSLYDVSTAGDVVTLRGSKVTAALRLVKKASAPPTTDVTICHKASGKKPKTMTVTSSAVNGHLGHGDTLGACP